MWSENDYFKSVVSLEQLAGGIIQQTQQSKLLKFSMFLTKASPLLLKKRSKGYHCESNIPITLTLLVLQEKNVEPGKE